MKGDGKGRFYRTLNLDDIDWKCIKLYRNIKKEIKKNKKKRRNK